MRIIWLLIDIVSLPSGFFLLKKSDNIDSKAGEYDKIGCRYPSGR